MNHYELLFVLKPTLTDEETKVQISKIQGNIIAQDATIVATDDKGMRKLAYPVDKNERGYYTVVYFQAPATSVHEIERLLRIDEDVLRFMTVKFSSKKDIVQFDKMANIAAKKSEIASETKSEKTPAETTIETETIVEETVVAETEKVADSKEA